MLKHALSLPATSRVWSMYINYITATGGMGVRNGQERQRQRQRQR